MKLHHLSSILLLLGLASASQASRQPNIIYILSDDHDHITATEEYMPSTYEHIVSAGRIYSHFYTPMSVCCPSRTGFFRSQHGHNHNITDVQAPFGGWDLFYERGFQNDNLGVWLRDSGVKTYYTGKLMNGNSLTNAQSKPTTNLFDESAILLDPYTYSFLNSSLSWNGGAPQSYAGNYSTDLIRDIGLQYLEKAAAGEEPFFLGIAPIGPHSTVSDGKFTNPIPAEKYKDLYKDVIIPRTANFNPDVPSGANWVKNLTKLNDTVVDYIDEWHRDRLRALKSVDDLVGAVVQRAKELNLLDNTYIIYTSDNGFSTGGQHRRPPSKSLGYEEDIRVPAFIRGPGIEAGSVNDETWSNIDLAASIVEISAATDKAGHPLDGRVMDWVREHGEHFKLQDATHDERELNATSRSHSSSTHHLSEYWVKNYPEGIYGGAASTSKYKTLRVRESSGRHTNGHSHAHGHKGTHDQDWAYTVWCNGERELYDMVSDPYQMTNLLGNVSEYATLKSNAHRLATRLDALTLSLKRCSGQECRQLWRNVFPDGQVTSLQHALSEQYDGYFDSLPRVSFDDCTLGFFADKEKPDWSQELVYAQA